MSSSEIKNTKVSNPVRFLKFHEVPNVQRYLANKKQGFRQRVNIS